MFTYVAGSSRGPGNCERFGSDRRVFLALMQTLPAEHRNKVGPFFEKKVKAKELYSSLVFDELDRHIIDRDREAPNRRLLYSVRQGKSQPFSKFLHIFEEYLSNAGELTPIGVSIIPTLSEAIAPYFRQFGENQTTLGLVTASANELEN